MERKSDFNICFKKSIYTLRPLGCSFSMPSIPRVPFLWHPVFHMCPTSVFLCISSAFTYVFHIQCECIFNFIQIFLTGSFTSQDQVEIIGTGPDHGGEIFKGHILFYQSFFYRLSDRRQFFPLSFYRMYRLLFFSSVLNFSCHFCFNISIVSRIFPKPSIYLLSCAVRRERPCW